MKKRMMALILLMALLVGVFPTAVPASAEENKTITKSEIIKKIDDYVNFLGLSNSTFNWYWNAGLRSKEGTAQLVRALDEYERTGDTNYLLVGLTNKCCPKTNKNGQHVHGTGGCTSNIFDGGAQCHGGALYFMYYIFGEFVISGDSYYKYTNANTSWDAMGGLQPGDMIRVNGHSMVYHTTAENGLINALQVNGYSSSKPCSLNFGTVYYTNSTKYSETILRQLFDQGRVTIRRYKYIVDCNHEYAFMNDTMRCVSCGNEFPMNFVSEEKYMDVVAVNGSGTAPTHANPYGSSKILTRFKKGETVFVKGYVTNFFGNKWHLVSTSSGDQYLNEDYLGEHKEANYYFVAGTDGKLAINSRKSAGYQIGTVPECAILVVDESKSSSTWKYVEYMGVKGFCYYKYLTKSAPYCYTGTICNTDGSLAINETPSSKYRIGIVPEGAQLTVYGNRRVGNWVWVCYNNVYGYAYSRYIK